jgi:hypothetical protein
MITSRILDTLFRMQGTPIPEVALLAELRVVSGRVGEQEFGTALARLKAAKLACCATDDLTGDRTWLITAAGTARVEGKA